MSPILDLQRRMRTLGRIRTGQQVPMSGGKRRPARLETFRLTSASRDLLEVAASLYGGKVEPWPERKEWQLVTKVDALDIVVPPGQAISQWWERWTAAGCDRRCDGATNVLTGEACECPADYAERRELAADGKACKPTTRLAVILPALPDIGTWTLEVHGYYAAVELAGTAEFLERATAEGHLVPARLRLDQREKRVPGQPVARYAVPVIELPQMRLAELIPGASLPALADGNGRKPSRRGRVERPPLGSAQPDLPADPTLVRPSAPLGQPPERVAGWEVEPSAVPAAEVLAPSLSLEDFLALLAERGVDVGYARAVRAEMFAANVELTAEQRHALAVRLGLLEPTPPLPF